MPVGIPIVRFRGSCGTSTASGSAIAHSNRRSQIELLAALPPADHLATFRWLYPDQHEGNEFNHYLYLSVLAQLQEHNGDRPMRWRRTDWC